MKCQQIATLVLTISLVLAGPALAQTVWRCGAEARSYSATPCREGVAIDVTDSRTADDVRAAREVAEREQRLGESLARDRARRERDNRAAQGSGLASIGPATPLAHVNAIPKTPPQRQAKPTQKGPARHPGPSAGTSREVARETRHARG